MGRTINGRTVNEQFDPRPWGRQEARNIEEIYNFLPDYGKRITDRHHHSRLENTADSAAVITCNAADRVGINDDTNYFDTLTVYRSGADQGININSDTGYDSRVRYLENGTERWATYYDASENRFAIYDSTRGADVMRFLDNSRIEIHPNASNAGDRVYVGSNSWGPSRMNVHQDSSTDAIGCLGLRQDDTDEEFLYIYGTAAAGVLTNSLVDDDDVALATPVGWFKIYVNDVGNQISDDYYYVQFHSLA